MILRPATPEDTAALATLGRESFCAAFEHLYRPEDLATFLTETYSEEAVAEEIAAIVLAEFPVSWLRLRLGKPGAVTGARDVGVIIERGDRPDRLPLV